MSFKSEDKLSRLIVLSCLFSLIGIIGVEKNKDKLFNLKYFIIPARTGRDSSNNTAVTNIAQPNSGTLCNTCPGIRILIIVVMT